MMCFIIFRVVFFFPNLARVGGDFAVQFLCDLLCDKAMVKAIRFDSLLNT